MKQTLSMIIVTAILLSAVSMFSLSVSAAEETISLYEAQSLVDKAHQFARGVHCFIEEVNPIADYSQGILVNLEEDSLGQQKYYRVNEEKLPGGSYEKMCEYARDIYTEDFAPYAYKFSPGYYGLLYQNENQTLSFNHCTVKVGGNYANHLPLFYRAENGVLYTSVYEMQGGVGVRLLDIHDSTSTIYFPYNNPSNIAMEIVNGDSDSAIGYVFWTYLGPIIPPLEIETAECKFVKTSDGWRIDESEFSVLCATSDFSTMEAYRSAVSPSTGDVSGERVAVIGAVSLACIIPTACLMRRRRRSSAE